MSTAWAAAFGVQQGALWSRHRPIHDLEHVTRVVTQQSDRQVKLSEVQAFLSKFTRLCPAKDDLFLALCDASWQFVLKIDKIKHFKMLVQYL